MKTRYFFHLLEYKILRKLHRAFAIGLFKNIMFEIKIIMKNDSLLEVKRNQNLHRVERIFYCLSFLKNNITRGYTFCSVKYRRLFFSIWLPFETFAFYLSPDGKILFPRENWKQLRISYHARCNNIFLYFFFFKYTSSYVSYFYLFLFRWMDWNEYGKFMLPRVEYKNLFATFFFFFRWNRNMWK